VKSVQMVAAFGRSLWGHLPHRDAPDTWGTLRRALSAMGIITLVIGTSAPALAQDKICPTDWSGRQTSDICWKRDRDGLFRRWSDTRQAFLPGPTLRLDGKDVRECDFRGTNCRPPKSGAGGPDR
jgi:hypothetical protein